MQKAVFVDRDGTLNVHRGYISSPDQIELLRGVAHGVKALNEAQYRVVVVTNQPVVARGDVSLAQLEQIHGSLDSLLRAEGAFLDAIYFCPHHPDGGVEGEIAALKIKCTCRKPNTGLIERAAREMNIDPARLWMIGDSWRDVLMAKRAGLRSILVETGEFGTTMESGAAPDFVCAEFGDAVDTIFDQSRSRT